MSWTCPTCGKRYARPCKHNCGQPKAPSKTPPSVLTRLKNVSLATVKHVCAGSPTCDQAEVDRRFEICQACLEYFDEERSICTHQSCGCAITDQPGYFRKLAWADQRCPVGKW